MLDAFGNNQYRNLNSDIVDQIDSTYYVGWPTTTMMEWTHGTPQGPNGHFLEQGHELVANKIYESDIIVFFGSVRWGKMNSIYSNLIERLTWIENMHSTLREKNPVKDKEAGVVVMGHNWKGIEVVENEVSVLKYFGFKTPKQLSFNRQWTNDPTDETNSGYKKDLKDFLEEKTIFESIKESFRDFNSWFEKKFS
jgi:multimeric flavodoxin WrbA